MYFNLKKFQENFSYLDELINIFKKYNKEFQEKSRISSILSNFEKKIYNDFRCFIIMSTKRLQEMKVGHSLEAISNNESELFTKVLNSFSQDPIYEDWSVMKEKDKITINDELNRKINRTRDQLKGIKFDSEFIERNKHYHNSIVLENEDKEIDYSQFILDEYNEFEAVLNEYKNSLFKKVGKKGEPDLELIENVKQKVQDLEKNLIILNFKEKFQVLKQKNKKVKKKKKGIDFVKIAKILNLEKEKNNQNDKIANREKLLSQLEKDSEYFEKDQNLVSVVKKEIINSANLNENLNNKLEKINQIIQYKGPEEIQKIDELISRQRLGKYMNKKETKSESINLSKNLFDYRSSLGSITINKKNFEKNHVEEKISLPKFRIQNKFIDNYSIKNKFNELNQDSLKENKLNDEKIRKWIYQSPNQKKEMKLKPIIKDELDDSKNDNEINLFKKNKRIRNHSMISEKMRKNHYMEFLQFKEKIDEIKENKATIIPNKNNSSTIIDIVKNESKENLKSENKYQKILKNSSSQILKTLKGIKKDFYKPKLKRVKSEMEFPNVFIHKYFENKSLINSPSFLKNNK